MPHAVLIKINKRLFLNDYFLFLSTFNRPEMRVPILNRLEKGRVDIRSLSIHRMPAKNNYKNNYSLMCTISFSPFFFLLLAFYFICNIRLFRLLQSPQMNAQTFLFIFRVASVNKGESVNSFVIFGQFMGIFSLFKSKSLLIRGTCNE